MRATKGVADSRHKLRYREDLAILPKRAARGNLPVLRGGQPTNVGRLQDGLVARRDARR